MMRGVGLLLAYGGKYLADSKFSLTQEVDNLEAGGLTQGEQTSSARTIPRLSSNGTVSVGSRGASINTILRASSMLTMAQTSLFTSSWLIDFVPSSEALRKLLMAPPRADPS